MFYDGFLVSPKGEVFFENSNLKLVEMDKRDYCLQRSYGTKDYKHQDIFEGDIVEFFYDDILSMTPPKFMKGEIVFNTEILNHYSILIKTHSDQIHTTDMLPIFVASKVKVLYNKFDKRNKN